MSKRDYYEVLGMQKDASEGDLKKAYRKLAIKYHPDQNQDDATAEKKFKELNEAYEALKDPQKRGAYDQFGHQAFEGGSAAHHSAHAQHGGFQGTSGFNSVFEEMFGEFMGDGHGPRQARAQKGNDLRYDMELSLEEAFTGLHKIITMRSAMSCRDCKGSGAKKGSSSTTCPQCHGVGVQHTQQGIFTMERPCVACQATGKIIKDSCGICHGQGRTMQPRKLKVSVAAGVDDGTRIRLTGEGEAGLHGASSGDLYVFISLQTHRLFKRSGEHLSCNVTIPMTAAVLGGDIEVPTIEGGKTKVKIPEETQSGKQFRLRGRGMTLMRQSRRGDLYILVTVETPVNLTSQQKDLMKKFETISQTHDNSPGATSFAKKLKEFWKSFKTD